VFFLNFMIWHALLRALALAQLTSFDHNVTSLYAGSGSVVAELTHLPTAEDGDGVHVVCFYASSCPHCQTFAPVWKRLAARLVSGGATGIRLSAVNCEGSTATQDLCIGQKIPDVPLMRAWVFASPAPAIVTLQPEELSAAASANAHNGEECAVLDWLLAHFSDHFPGPLVEALRADLRRQQQVASARRQDVLMDHNWNGAEQGDLELHDAQLVAGNAQLVADFDAFDRNGDAAITGAELCAAWHKLGRNLTMADCATIIAAADASHSGTLDFNEFLAVEASGLHGSHNHHRFPILEESVSPHERLADVTFAINYAMHHGVFAGAHVLSRPRRQALIAWLLVLAQILPYASLREDVRKLLSAVRAQPQLAQLEHWREYLSKWSLGGHRYHGEQFDVKVSYSSRGCGGGRSHSNRFTCSLWVCFHMLAASCAPEQGGHCPVHPRQIMHGIFLMVKWFFGCRECRDHFLAEYHACEHGRCDIDFDDPVVSSRGIVIWLWKAHNSVTLRLATQHRQNRHVNWRPDPLLRNLAFPSQAHCNLCWGAARHIGNRWNHNATHHFLRATYWDSAWDSESDASIASPSSRLFCALSVLGCLFATVGGKLTPGSQFFWRDNALNSRTHWHSK
jgi:thiol-disulfide isomerase/thioredoxin